MKISRVLAASAIMSCMLTTAVFAQGVNNTERETYSRMTSNQKLFKASGSSMKIRNGSGDEEITVNETKNPVDSLVEEGVITKKQADAAKKAIAAALRSKSTIKEALDNLVEKETITQSQADEIIKVFPQREEKAPSVEKITKPKSSTEDDTMLTKDQVKAVQEAIKEAKASGDTLEDVLNDLVEDETISQVQVDKIIDVLSTKKEEDTRGQKMMKPEGSSGEKKSEINDEEQEDGIVNLFLSRDKKALPQKHIKDTDSNIEEAVELTKGQVKAVEEAIQDGIDTGITAEEALDSLVEDGTITQDQADKLIEVLPSKTEKSDFRNQDGNLFSSITEDNEMTQDQVDAVKEALDSIKNSDGTAEEVLDSLVEAGTITQTQADAITDMLSAKLEKSRPENEFAKFIDTIIEEGTVTQEQADAIQEAIEAASDTDETVEDVLDSLVEEGTITQEAEDAIIDALELMVSETEQEN